MNTLKIFILIGILILIGGGIFLIQKREIPETKIPEKKEIRIETKEKSEITLISVYDNY